MLQQKALLFFLRTSKNVSNLSLRTYHETRVLNKKLGIFSQVQNKTEKDAVNLEHKKVRLYPGFQASVEEVNQSSLLNKTQKNDLGNFVYPS